MGEQEGCQTFDQALFTLCKEGRIKLDQALINADSANNLRLKMKLAGLLGDEEGEKMPFAASSRGKETGQAEAFRENSTFRLRKS